MRTVWRGTISFGLVTIPVRLYVATESKNVPSRQIHVNDGGRVQYKRVCSIDGEEVEYSDIAKGYELPDPMETNLYHLTPEQREERGIVALPETLGEAIDELAHSELAKQALGRHIFDRYIELKRKEWDEYRVQLTSWELERYLPVL
jgi:hypothetical protein